MKKFGLKVKGEGAMVDFEAKDKAAALVVMEEQADEWGVEIEEMELIEGGLKIESSYVCEGCGAVWDEDFLLAGLSDEGDDWHCSICRQSQKDPNIED